MLLKLLAVGTKLPQWIQQGYREYAQRMPRECRLELFEIALGARSTTAEKAR
ncbi:MAG: 23S rRNA (pseudouridine(1915)-N(3))-methyltransferase RlmH, partial [Chromatiales bacterium]